MHVYRVMSRLTITTSASSSSSWIYSCHQHSRNWRLIYLRRCFTRGRRYGCSLFKSVSLMGATYIFHRVFDFHGYMNVDLSTGAGLGMERDCVWKGSNGNFSGWILAKGGQGFVSLLLLFFFEVGWWGERGGKMTGSSADLLTSFWINVIATVALLIFFALFKNQPLNFRVYFPRWYVHGMDERVEDFVIVGESKRKAGRYVNLSWKSYAHTMDWIWSTLRMTEAELIELVGLDSTVLLRIFLLGYGNYEILGCCWIF